MLISGNFAGIPEDVFKELLFAEILIPEAEQELDIVLKRSQAIIADDKTLRYIIKAPVPDIDNIISNIEHLLPLKKYNKLLIEWHEDATLINLKTITQYTQSCKNLQKGISMHTRLN